MCVCVSVFCVRVFVCVITYFCQGGHEDPEGDDKGDLDALEVDVEDVVGVLLVAVAVVPGLPHRQKL